MPVEYHNGIPCFVRKVEVDFTEQTAEHPAFSVRFSDSSREYNEPVTVICIYTESKQFLILKGNHTAALHGLAFQAMRDYFYQHLDQAHSHSEHGQKCVIGADGKIQMVSGGY